MDHEIITDALYKWLTEFVEIPNKLLGNWPPCPYARKARLDNNFSITFANHYDLDNAITDAKTLLTSKDIVVICFDHKIVSAEYIQQFVRDINKILMQEDFVILEDHPNIPEFINGVCMNFKGCGLLLVQRLSKLQNASQQLQSKGYYHNWTTQDLDNVVTWRQNLNSAESI